MPMFCLLAIFTVTELQVNLPNKPNVATVSMCMQLISAPESNKHENTNPPVSVLNVVPHAMLLLMVNTWEEPLLQFKYSLGVYLAGSQSVSFPKISGVDSPITCVNAASYNLWNFEKIAKVITFYCIDGLCIVQS